jgi:hypothetical protein
MAVFSLFSRHRRTGVLWNATDHVVQVARLSRLDERPVRLDLLAELTPGDDEALAQWLRTAFPERRSGYVPAYCGFHPVERVLLRETIAARRLGEPGYLPQLLAETAKLSGVNDWQVSALHPSEGDLLTTGTAARPGLLFGLPHAVVRESQQRLCKAGLLPRRLEVGSIALVGALTRYIRETGYPHATVACEIGLGQTRLYFLGKDGVHTPATLPHGLLSIMEATMKELGAPGIGAARDALFAPTDELRSHSRRLVRMLTRHLKPAVDYFEMQTGQPIGALFCAHLPAKLSWLEEALCAAIDLEFLVPDFKTWLPAIGLELAPGAEVPPRSWFQPLSLVAQLAPGVPAHEAKA